MKRIKELYTKYKEIINYLIIGGLTTFVSLAVYYGLTLTILNPNNGVELQIANVASWVVGVLFAYFTNRKFVFSISDKANIKEGTKFCLARLATLFVDMALMYVFVTRLSFNDKIIKIIAQIIVIVLNYVFSKFIVFKKEDSKKKKNN